MNFDHLSFVVIHFLSLMLLPSFSFPAQEIQSTSPQEHSTIAVFPQAVIFMLVHILCNYPTSCKCVSSVLECFSGILGERNSISLYLHVGRFRCDSRM